MAKGGKENGIFAALGAATGLGNALRFPSLCATYGGGFAFAYVLSLLLVCYPLMCAELYIGKRYALSFDKAIARCAPKLGWLAYVAAANSALIAVYYGVIGAKIGGAALSFTVCGFANDTKGVALVAVGALFLAAVFFVLKGSRTADSGRLSVCSSLILLAVLAVVSGAKGGRIFRVFLFGFSELLNGGLWADALGQALLALSLAGGVMPTFARSFGRNFSISGTAAKIIFANLCGCFLAAVATLSISVPVLSEGGVTVALELFPRVINEAFANAVLRRIFGTLFFAALWLVAVQSACSLFSPVLGFVKEDSKGRAVCLLCCLSFALLPLFAANNCAAMRAVDQTACSVNAVIIAFCECLIALFNREKEVFTGKRAKAVGFSLKYFCPFACGALALFSACGARFSHFPPYASACAAVSLVLVFSPAIVRIVKGFYLTFLHCRRA